MYNDASGDTHVLDAGLTALFLRLAAQQSPAAPGTAGPWLADALALLHRMRLIERTVHAGG